VSAYRYDMFTRAGDARVDTLVRQTKDKIRKGITIQDLNAFLAQRIDKIAERYPEVGDTAVRDAIYYDIRSVADELGLDSGRIEL